METERFTLSPFPGLVERKAIPRSLTVVSDFHIPFHSPSRLGAVLDHLETAPPDVLIVLGDVFDAYPISRWDRSRKRHKTLREEARQGKPILDRINSLPSQIVYLLGNHEERLEKLLDRQPELEGYLGVREVYGIPDRWTIYPPRTLYRVGDLIFLHGDVPNHRGGFGSERKLLGMLHHSCVFAHTHSSGSYFTRGQDNQLLRGYAIGHLSAPEVSREYRPINDRISGYAEVRYGGALAEVNLRLVSDNGIII